MNYLRASVVYFSSVSIYHGPHTYTRAKVMVVRISRKLPYSIFCVSRYYASESNIRLKSNDYLNYSRAFLVHFLASRYIMGLIHKLESKVMAVRICRDVLCSSSSVWIYFTPELDIQVKSNDHLNFSRASTFLFRASRYIMGLRHTPESKVMVV